MYFSLFHAQRLLQELNYVVSYSPNPCLHNAPNGRIHKVLSMEWISNYSDQLAKMQYYFMSKNCSKAKLLYPNGWYSSQKHLFWPLRPFVDDIFQNCLLFCELRARKILQPQNFGFWWGHISFWNYFFEKHIICNPLPAVMAKEFLEKNEKPSEIFRV